MNAKSMRSPKFALWFFTTALAVPVHAQPLTFESETGWTWLSRPFLILADSTMSSASGEVALVIAPQPGKVNVYLAYSAEWKAEGRQIRPVLFDGQPRRLPSAQGGSSSTGRIRLDHASFNTQGVAADSPLFFGIEVMGREGEKVRADAAAERAQQAGIETLPLPRVGEPYEFALTTLDGRRVSSADYRGKLLLVDCWATWCSPCMAKMAPLKVLLKKWQTQGFEILGVTLDFTEKEARRSIATHELPWPNVWVPADEQVRALWRDRATVANLPRLFLVGPDGRLLADLQPSELEKRIESEMRSFKKAKEE